MVADPDRIGHRGQGGVHRADAREDAGVSHVEGSGLSSATSLSIGAASDTARPRQTSLAAATTCVGEILFNAPRRSAGPHRACASPGRKGPGTRPRSAQSRPSRQDLSCSAGGPSASGGGLSAGTGELGTGRTARERSASGSGRQLVVRTAYQSHLLGGVRPFPAYVTDKGGPPAHQRAEAVAEAGQEADVDEQPDDPGGEAGEVQASHRNDRVEAVNVSRVPPARWCTSVPGVCHGQRRATSSPARRGGCGSRSGSRCG